MERISIVIGIGDDSIVIADADAVPAGADTASAGVDATSFGVRSIVYGPDRQTNLMQLRSASKRRGKLLLGLFAEDEIMTLSNILPVAVF